MRYGKSDWRCEDSFQRSPNHNGAIYDSAGDLTTMTGGVTFNYDAENRISSSVLNNSTTMYFYDGDGRRVAKVDCPAGMGTFAPTRPL